MGYRGNFFRFLPNRPEPVVFRGIPGFSAVYHRRGRGARRIIFTVLSQGALIMTHRDGLPRFSASGVHQLNCTHTTALPRSAPRRDVRASQAARDDVRGPRRRPPHNVAGGPVGRGIRRGGAGTPARPRRAGRGRDDGRARGDRGRRPATAPRGRGRHPFPIPSRWRPRSYSRLPPAAVPVGAGGAAAGRHRLDRRPLAEPFVRFAIGHLIRSQDYV